MKTTVTAQHLSSTRSAPPVRTSGVSDSFIESLEAIGAPRELIEQVKRQSAEEKVSR